MNEARIFRSTSQRSLEPKQFADFTIDVADKEIKVHKIVLSKFKCQCQLQSNLLTKILSQFLPGIWKNSQERMQGIVRKPSENCGLQVQHCYENATIFIHKWVFSALCSFASSRTRAVSLWLINVFFDSSHYLTHNHNKYFMVLFKKEN